MPKEVIWTLTLKEHHCNLPLRRSDIGKIFLFVVAPARSIDGWLDLRWMLGYAAVTAAAAAAVASCFCGGRSCSGLSKSQISIHVCAYVPSSVRMHIRTNKRTHVHVKSEMYLDTKLKKYSFPFSFFREDRRH